MSGIRFKSAGKWHGRTRQHMVAVPNLWVKIFKVQNFGMGVPSGRGWECQISDSVFLAFGGVSKMCLVGFVFGL